MLAHLVFRIAQKQVNCNTCNYMLKKMELLIKLVLSNLEKQPVIIDCNTLVLLNYQ